MFEYVKAIQRSRQQEAAEHRLARKVSRLRPLRNR